MLDFIRQYQLDIMLMMSSVCLAIAFFAAISRRTPPRRKHALVLLEISSAVLLLADRFVYIYNGDMSALGFWMMRICNFAVYFCAPVITYAFTLYLSDVCVREGWYDETPKRLQVCFVLLIAGALLVIISQFTGLYYTFDEFNNYERAPGYIICYIVPAIAYGILISIIVQNFGRMRPITRISLAIFIIGPIAAAIFQAFTPWVSVNNMSLVFFGIFLYSVDLVDLNNQIENAHRREIELSQARELQARLMFEQTASALASAIDEKDAYTQGHSARVAAYSRLIAERAGEPEEFCNQMYYAGLLHDVGKIGIPDNIITKAGSLTEAEYEIIKTHPERGGRILASIAQSPYLQTGARYHHERYDGDGYPEGLAGEQIPRIARIITVADAYDAMSSRRSYRKVMAQDEVRAEIEHGLGTQFDPEYGRIMLQIIDDDSDYQLRESAHADAATSPAANPAT